MIDPTTIRLNETLYRERLQAAAQAQHWRATSVTAPSFIEWLRQAIGIRLISLGLRMQVPVARTNVYR